MSNELIEINEQTAIEAFSAENGLDVVIAQARELVEGFEHDLSTAAGRKRTASLAAKVAKLKTRMDKLGKSLTDDWAKKKKAVDVNRKSMRDQLDELKAEARKPLDEWEAEQAEIERKKEVEVDHEIGLLMNEKFDADRAAAIEAECKAEEERQAQLKAEQEARDKRIAEEAAERERLAAIERENQIKAQAEQAERARIAAEERAKIQAEQAEIARIAAEKKAKEDAERAAEAAKQAEIARQEAEAKRLADEQAAREANKAHIGKIRKEAKESLMEIGLTEDQAKAVVLAINAGKIQNVTINY